MLFSLGSLVISNLLFAGFLPKWRFLSYSLVCLIVICPGLSFLSFDSLLDRLIRYFSSFRLLDYFLCVSPEFVCLYDFILLVHMIFGFLCSFSNGFVRYWILNVVDLRSFINTSGYRAIWALNNLCHSLFRILHLCLRRQWR